MDDLRAELRRLLDVAAEEPGAPLRLPGGVAWNPTHLHGPVHMIDGDGTALCQGVGADDLVLIEDDTFTTAEPTRGCGDCQLLLGSYRGWPI